MRKQEIQSFGEVFNGKTPSKSEQRSSGHPILKIRDIDEIGRFRGIFESFVDHTFYEKYAKKKLKTGDTIILNAAHNADYVGSKTALVSPDLQGIVPTGEWLIVRTKHADPRYVNHYLKSPSGRKSLKNCVKGIHLYPKDVARILVPIPPVDDQIRIAHLLGKVENLIDQRKKNLQQLDELLKSVFLEMFAPQAHGYDNWPVVEIRELAEDHKGSMRTGPFGSNLLHSEFTTEGEIAVLGIDNAVQNSFGWGERRFITGEKYKELKNYRVFPGDVIVTIMGTIGRSAVVPEDIPLAINTKHLAAITLNRKIANPLFLSYSIHSSPFILNQFRSKNRGAIMSGLNLGIIKETKLKRPPIELQNKFSDIHDHVDNLKAIYQKSLDDLEVLYCTLSHQAFKSELDLSRVPLHSMKAEEEKTLEIAPAPVRAEEVFTIDLPAPDNLLNVLDNTEERKLLITQWLEAYCGQLGTTPFSVQRFMAIAETRLAELHPDVDFELGANDYEHVKGWVFAALDEGRIKQARNITGREESGKPIFGNVMEIKCGVHS